MEKEEHLLKVTENPQEQLIMLWMMNFIYDKAKEVVENFKILKQETEEIEKILVAFEPGKDNLPEQVEGLRPAHQALIKALENSLGKQIPEELCSIPEELRDFDDLVERITQALKGNNVEALTASTAVDIILGETYIDDLAIRFRSYIKELVLDIIDENGAEFLDENAEAGLFDLVEKGDITKILKLLKPTDTELKARQNELGKTLVSDILEIRAKIRGQYAKPILTLKERTEESFETALDEVLDEDFDDEIDGGKPSLDTIERQLSKLSPREEIVLRVRNGIKKLRRNTELENLENSTLSAGDLMMLRTIEQKTRRNILSHQLLATDSEEESPEEPLPDNITPLF